METIIIGAGIGGLTTALSLHAIGQSQITIIESAKEILNVGVGLNLPPHAVRELTELGLGDQLASIGMQTLELSYYDPQGKPIWSEPRGLDAGYQWPQYSIHRGKLQNLLLNAVYERLGKPSVHTGVQAISAVTHQNGRVHLETKNLKSEKIHNYQADLVVAADGIRSRLRDQLRGQSTPIATNGWVMYRGATSASPFLTGHTMVIVGDEHQRIVVYPIGDGIINWLLVRPKDAATNMSELGNWNIDIPIEKVASYAKGWSFDWLDIHALIQNTANAYEYPMADIDTLNNWVFGHCVILGDAAHAMYPFGSNGASQAILDARILAYQLGINPDLNAALEAFELERLPATAKIQIANRTQAGATMKKVSELSRQNLVAEAAQILKEVEQRYRLIAGFDVESLNSRCTWSIQATRH